MASPELANVLAHLDECRARLSALGASATPVSADDLAGLSKRLSDLADELRAWATGAPTRSAATPGTLRSLLSLARADLARQLTADATPDEHLVRVVHLAERLIPGTEHAAVSVLPGGERVETAAATSTVPAALDAAQQQLCDGPAFHVSEVHESLRIDDLRTDVRWPKFAASALELGVRSALICELPATSGPNAILSLYAGRRRAFNNTSVLVAPVFASRAAIALAHADEVFNLRRAIGSRQVIGEAVGILMERHRISADQAFDRLVAASQHGHIKLRELAVRITETGEEPEAAVLEA